MLQSKAKTVLLWLLGPRCEAMLLLPQVVMMYLSNCLLNMSIFTYGINADFIIFSHSGRQIISEMAVYCKESKSVKFLRINNSSYVIAILCFPIIGGKKLDIYNTP